MDSCLSKKDSRALRFWNHYIKILNKQRVNTPANRWYIKHPEHYTTSLSNKKLPLHTVKNLTGYFIKTDKSTDLKDWQYRQIVRAIQNLFKIINRPWFKQIDWRYIAHTLALLRYQFLFECKQM